MFNKSKKSFKRVHLCQVPDKFDSLHLRIPLAPPLLCALKATEVEAEFGTCPSSLRCPLWLLALLKLFLSMKTTYFAQPMLYDRSRFYENFYENCNETEILQVRGIFQNRIIIYASVGAAIFIMNSVNVDNRSEIISASSAAGSDF
jgi:hypothetical protein